MAAKKRAATKKAAGQPAAKRQKKSDDPIWCTENKRSPLVHDDLHALYSNPQTYEHWTKEDWEEARQCLPGDAPYNEDGYSVPMTYFRYDTDWRRYVREFQEDLGAGRYDPEWQRQAKQAMEERARGDFDSYKADQYEQFWGQKQKTSSRELAGESAQVKLSELVQQTIVRPGDIFSYERVFGRGKDRIMVEKDAKIVKAEGGMLTLAVPPGQLKYAKYLSTPEITPEKPSREGPASPKHETTPQKEIGFETAFSDDPSVGRDYEPAEMGPEQMPEGALLVDNADAEQKANRESRISQEKRSQANSKSQTGKNASLQPTVDEDTDKSVERPLSPITDDNAQPGAVSNASTGVQRKDGSTGEGFSGMATVANAHNRTPPPSQDPVEDVILVTVPSLTELERRMVEIDGRIDMKGFRSANSWKAIRGKRDNQDMGSLFDMREEFYVNKSSTIVKVPKGSRSGRRELKATMKG